MLVGVEGDRAAMVLEIALAGLEVGEGALRAHEAQLHQPAGRIVDEDEQRAGVGAILEPAMLAAVDLHQLAQGLAAQPRLMKRAALLAGEPQARPRHPARSVSRETFSPCSASISAASVGPKSA